MTKAKIKTLAMSREKAQDVLVGLREILSQTLGDE